MNLLSGPAHVITAAGQIAIRFSSEKPKRKCWQKLNKKTKLAEEKITSNRATCTCSLLPMTRIKTLSLWQSSRVISPGSMLLSPSSQGPTRLLVAITANVGLKLKYPGLKIDKTGR